MQSLRNRRAKLGILLASVFMTASFDVAAYALLERHSGVGRWYAVRRTR